MIKTVNAKRALEIIHSFPREVVYEADFLATTHREWASITFSAVNGYIEYFWEGLPSIAILILIELEECNARFI